MTKRQIREPLATLNLGHASRVLKKRPGFELRTKWPYEYTRLHNMKDVLRKLKCDRRLFLQEFTSDTFVSYTTTKCTSWIPYDKKPGKHPDDMLNKRDEMLLLDGMSEDEKNNEYDALKEKAGTKYLESYPTFLKSDKPVMADTFEWVSGNKGKGYVVLDNGSDAIFINVDLSPDEPRMELEIKFLIDWILTYRKGHRIRSAVVGGTFNIPFELVVTQFKKHVPEFIPVSSTSTSKRTQLNVQDTHRCKDGFILIGEGRLENEEVFDFFPMDMTIPLSDHKMVCVDYVLDVK